MTDDAPRWFDDDTEPPVRPRRLTTLLVAAVVPWVVLALVLLRGPSPAAPDDTLGAGGLPASSGDHHPADAPAPTAAPPTDTATDTDTDTDTDPTDPERGSDHTRDHTPGDDPHDDPIDGHAASLPPSVLDDARGDGHGSLEHPTRVAHGVAEALVVAITRAWLSDVGPDLELDGVEIDRSGYLEHVAVERITLEGDALAVATVTVVVLDRDGDRYAGATVRRAAVPLRVTPTTVHPAGQPWWLPSALDLTPHPPELAAVDDDAVTTAVGEALEAAGYRDPTVDDLAVTDGGTIVASISATTSDDVPVRSAVWLRLDTGAGATVLGHHEDDTT